MSDKRTKAIEIKRFLLDMIKDARSECRELTDEEQKLFDEQKNELLALSEEIKATDDKLQEIEDALPDIEEKAEEDEQEPETPADAPADEAPAEGDAPAEEPTGEGAEEQPEQTPDGDEEEEKKENPNQTDEETINKETEPEEKPSGEEDEQPEDEEKQKENKSSNIRMKQTFSLLKAIRASVNKDEKYDAMTMALIEEGRKDFRDAGLDVTSSILLPGEARTISVTNEHDEVVKEDWEPLLLPLFKNKILDKAHRITGLRNDLRLPSIEAVDCYWEGENTQNRETTTSFDHVVMKPHRISASIYLSKQFLLQESVGAEQTIRNLLIEALAQKLESTFLGKGAADNTGGKNIPAGLLNGLTPKVVDNFAKLCEFEAEAVDACYDLNGMEYALSPSAWAKIRGTFQYGGKYTAMVMEGNTIDGRAYAISQNLEKDEFVLINWDDIYIGQWGGTEISVDSTSHDMARTNQVCVTINAYFDALSRRPEAIQLASVTTKTVDSSTD